MVVVGAALRDGAGRVLAAQRAGPAELAGRWEFPGGKVEAGETERAALVRECREELGVEVEVGERLGGDVPLGGGQAVLRVWTGRVVAGTPVAHEHTALRWLVADQLDEVDWLPADRPLAELLRSPAGRAAAGLALGHAARVADGSVGVPVESVTKDAHRQA